MIPSSKSFSLHATSQAYQFQSSLIWVIYRADVLPRFAYLLNSRDPLPDRIGSARLLVQPEAAPLLPSHSQLTDRDRRRRTHSFFWPAHGAPPWAH
jgi:hypothetical protein